MDQIEFEAELKREGYEPRLAELPPNEVHQEHAHGFDAKLLILEGAMTIVCDGTSHTYRPGESFIMPAGRPHEEHIGPEGVRYVAGRRHAAA